MNELGVGLVYFQGFENFLASHSSLIDVVEIEPQTFWYDKNDECNAFKYDETATGFLRNFGCPKLLEGVKTAAANIRHYQAEMNLPFAFETGANYLKPRKNEIPDGLFVRNVAEEADCYILIDLHNILANQRNGRQSVKEFLDYLPYERVIELHVGGGTYYKDYYLDAHSGPSDKELFDILSQVVGKLPNLKALVFEIDPESFNKVPKSAIINQLFNMRQIWDRRGYYYRQKKRKPGTITEQSFDENISVNDWECTVGKLVLGNNPGNELAKELLNDKGIAIIKDMVFNFRGSVLISMLKLTTRLLRLSAGEDFFNKCVNDFFDQVFPELLPVVMAGQFSTYIKSNHIEVPYLEKVLEYELASIYTAIDKQDRSVSFDFDPQPVFAALENAKLPAEQPEDKSVILQVVFDESSLKSELPGFIPVAHN
jgi:hypothetical protein